MKCGCNLADCVTCNEQWDRYEEDGPMDLEDQLEKLLDACPNCGFPEGHSIGCFPAAKSGVK